MSRFSRFTITRRRLGVAVAIVLVSLTAAAQPPEDRERLRDRVRARYDVVSLRDGVGLIPRQERAGIRVIEISGGLLAVNGEPVSGAELRQRIGEDAELMLQLTYLSDDERRTLLGLAAAQESATPAPVERESVEPETPAGATRTPEPPARTRRSDDIVRIGGSVTVSADEHVSGDVVVIGGSLGVDGNVDGDVVLIGGTLRLGPQAVVGGDVVGVGAAVQRDPGARIRGRFSSVGWGGGPGGDWRGWGWPAWAGPSPTVMRFGGVVLTLVRIGLFLLGAWIVIAVARATAERMAERAAADPLKAGLVGLLAQLLFLPVLLLTIVILAISIVGIPLLLRLPFAILAAAIAVLVGFVGVALAVGRGVRGWRGLAAPPSPYATAALGIAVITALAFAGKLLYLAGGFFTMLGAVVSIVALVIEYAAWTTAIGTVVLSRFAPRPAEPLVPAASAPPPQAA
jgi:hypothetical protein